MSSCRGDSSEEGRPGKQGAGLQGAVYSLDGLPPDLGHDGTFSPEVLIAQAQEIVDDQGCEKRVHSKPLPSTGRSTDGRTLSSNEVKDQSQQQQRALRDRRAAP